MEYDMCVVTGCIHGDDCDGREWSDGCIRMHVCGNRVQVVMIVMEI